MVEVVACAPGAHIGENKTLGFLRQNLSGNHVIFTNYHLPDWGGTLEIDLLVFNYYGIFLLEVKHWWGQIDADQTHWLQAGRRHASPLTQIDNKVKAVHSALRQNCPGIGPVSVVGFVVLSKGNKLLKINDPRSNRVFPLDNRLVHALGSREFLYNPRHSVPLKSSWLAAAREALLHQHIDPERRLVGSFHIVDELTPGEGFEAFEAQHVNIPSHRVRLKKYHIPAIQSQRHLDESVRQFKRDMEALAQVGDHPNIVHAYDFFKDPDVDDTYYLALEFVDGRMLREVIDQDGAIGLVQSLQYLEPVVNALIACHDRGIIHRNLTPYSIFITQDGRVKLGDFDFARVPEISQTITKTGKPLVINKYIAPEQLDDARAVDTRADLYSLGVIWYDLLFHRPETEPVRQALIARSAWPQTVRQLLLSLLSTQPDQRPASAHEVAANFQRILGKG